MALSVPSLQQLASGLPEEVQRALRSALSAQDVFNRGAATLLSDVTPGPWLRPSYQNGWVDSSATRFVRYRLELGGTFARMEGAMVAGTVNSTAFTLPQPFWPFQRLNFAIASNAAFGQLRIDVDGTVTLTNGSNVSANCNVAWALP